MRRKIIWLAVVLPACFYLLLFFTEALPPWNGAAPGSEPGSSAPPSLGMRLHYLLKVGLPQAETIMSRGISVLIAMAIGLGVINLFRVQGATLLHKRPGWPMALIVFVSFAAVFGAMQWQYRLDDRRRGLERETDAAWKQLGEAQRISNVTERDAALAQLSPADWDAIHRRQDYEDVYQFEPRTFFLSYVNTPLEATVMALLGFYLTYAAYRAFRIRSVEATVMMLSAAVVILGDAFGNWLSHGLTQPAMEFDMVVLNSGMQRGLLLGIGVATIAVSLRVLLGLERGIVDVQQRD